MLGFSAQDYIVRSADALFIPLGALVLAALLCLILHLFVLRESRHHPDRLRFVAKALVALGAVLLGIGIASVFWAVPLVGRAYLLGPLSPGVGVLLIWYSFYLLIVIVPGNKGASLRPSMPRWFPSASLGIVLSAILLSLFWTTTEYARALGRGRARLLSQDLSALPRATIYSKDGLALTGPGIEEALIGGDGAAYNYRYTGLRFFIRSDMKYFLLPEQWSRQQGSAIVLSETVEIRLEFQPGRS